MTDDALTTDPDEQPQTATDEPPFPPTTPADRPDVHGGPPNLDPDENAPYGYMIDPDTGVRRPKIRAGRRPKPKVTPPPAVENLTKIKGSADDDRPPQRPKSRTGAKAAKEPIDAPPFRAGPIAKWANTQYVRVGKIVRAWDRDIGSSMIAITRKESDDDVTVGECWEEIARTNPRIRALLARMMEGTAWGALFMVHMPILLALLMKDGIRRRLPFGNLLSSLLDDDEHGPSDISEALGGITPADVQQMMAAAQGMFFSGGMPMPRSSTLSPPFNPTESVIPGNWANDETASQPPESAAS